MLLFFQDVFKYEYFFRLDNPLLFVILAMFLIIIIIYVFSREVLRPVKIRFEKELIEKEAERLKALAAYVDLSNEKERERIARELHDGIGQMLTYIKLLLNEMEEEIKPGSGAGKKSEEIREVVTSISKDIRNIAMGLKPKILEELGLEPAIRILVETTSEQHSIKGSFYPYDLVHRYAPEFELNLYRIVQELLNNIVKHAKATGFTLQVFDNDKTVNITLEDDGKGFDVQHVLNSKEGLGLQSLYRRVNSHNGFIEISSGPGGTEVLVEMPKRGVNGQN
ncbi:MAG: sensor histidine kinase [Ignavibacteriaceae bacterium]